MSWVRVPPPALFRKLFATTTYDVLTINRAGVQRVHEYASDDELGPGAVVRLKGRDWLIDSVDVEGRLVATPARYRLRLVHPDGREELGAFRRYRDDAPTVGHTLSTLEDGAPISWQVVDSRLAEDEQGEP
jgi:hypothetical protein